MFLFFLCLSLFHGLFFFFFFFVFFGFWIWHSFIHSSRFTLFFSVFFLCSKKSLFVFLSVNCLRRYIVGFQNKTKKTMFLFKQTFQQKQHIQQYQHLPLINHQKNATKNDTFENEICCGCLEICAKKTKSPNYTSQFPIKKQH